MLKRLLGVGLAAVALSASNVAAQVEIEANAMAINLTGRLHAMWDYSSASEDLSSVFLIRRARLTMEIEVNDFISGKIQPEFSTGFSLENGLRLKDAYVDMTFAPEFRVRMGQFKRPFDLFELTSSTQTLVIERTGVVRGVDPSCAGVGSICSYSRLTEKLGYSERDVGLMIGGVIDDNWVWSASFTNGTIFEDVVRFISEDDTTEVFSEGKSFGGRLEYRGDKLRVGANAAAHDFANDSTLDEVDYGFAYGADLEWGSYTSGLHVQAGITAGDNWRDLDTDGDPTFFWTTQGIVTYKIPVSNNRFVEAIEPVGRVSYADLDAEATDEQINEGLLLTPGFVVYFIGRNKVALNVDIFAPGDDNDTEYSVKVMSYLHF
ncbi:MAG: hypothetical protein JSV86_07930 [Gemmatimonadota bacterium]|nr:MAG: hypothetical protein JSV86_07930 [Gemmatimonadota bacterium]